MAAVHEQDIAENRAAFIGYDLQYVTITGFHVFGATNGPGSGIAVSSPDAKHISHHIRITGNIVQDAGGDGILLFQTDYGTIDHNTVFNTGRYDKLARGSGISIVASTDIDDNRGVKMIVDSNRSYNNTNVPFCPGLSGAALDWCHHHSDSDGSGIILDANAVDWTYDSGVSPNVRQPAYRGRMLVSNNIVWNNGGRGVHVFRTNNADVWNNTMFGNNVDPWNQYNYAAELNITQSWGTSAQNNVMVSAGGRGWNGTPRVCAYVGPFGGNISLNRNWCFRYDLIPGTSPTWLYPDLPGVSVGMMLQGDPRLGSDFMPEAGSPVLGKSNVLLGMPLFDAMGVRRGSSTALGAFDNSRD